MPAFSVMRCDNKKVKDHLGQEFNSITGMCRFYGITIGQYVVRGKLGWSLEKILTEPIRENNKHCMDHLGQEFNSITEKWLQVENL